MAHSTLHAAIGMAAGLAIGLPVLTDKWKSRQPLAGPMGRWMVTGAACAAWAMVPSLLHFAGAPESVCGNAWMHVFFLHPAIASLHRWTGFAGPILLAALLAMQYVAMLAAIKRTRIAEM
jgi:hypothetical protein